LRASVLAAPAQPALQRPARPPRSSPPDPVRRPEAKACSSGIRRWPVRRPLRRLGGRPPWDQTFRDRARCTDLVAVLAL